MSELSRQSSREPLLVAAGDALAAKLSTITHDAVDDPDWWDDLEARVERWQAIAGEVRADG